MCVWSVEQNQSTQWKPMHAQREDANVAPKGNRKVLGWPRDRTQDFPASINHHTTVMVSPSAQSVLACDELNTGISETSVLLQSRGDILRPPYSTSLVIASDLQTCLWKLFMFSLSYCKVWGLAAPSTDSNSLASKTPFESLGGFKGVETNQDENWIFNTCLVHYIGCPIHAALRQSSYLDVSPRLLANCSAVSIFFRYRFSCLVRSVSTWYSVIMSETTWNNSPATANRRSVKNVFKYSIFAIFAAKSTIHKWEVFSSFNAPEEEQHVSWHSTAIQWPRDATFLNSWITM